MAWHVARPSRPMWCVQRRPMWFAPVFCPPRMARAVSDNMTTLQDKAFSAGKYLITPLSRRIDSGLYTSSVSIRSGRGSGTHDRIYRFVCEFASRELALLHAVAQGHDWLRQNRAAA